MPAWIPHRRLLLLVLLLAGLIYGIDRLVVTDREAIEAVVADATQAVREGDFERLRELLDEDYQGKGGTRSGAVALVQALWRTWRPLQLETSLGEIDLGDGETARAPLRVRGLFVGRPLVIDLETTYRKQATEGWKVSAARVVAVGELVRPGS